MSLNSQLANYKIPDFATQSLQKPSEIRWSRNLVFFPQEDREGEIRLEDLETLSDAMFLTLCYQRFLHRLPDAVGYNHHLDLLRTHKKTRAQIIKSFKLSPEAGRKKSGFRRLALKIFFLKDRFYRFTIEKLLKPNP